jgi:cytochrome c peroxidase
MLRLVERQGQRLMHWKVPALLISAFAALGITILVAHHAPGGSVSRDGYRRPAEIPHPADNSYSAEKTELGRKLFFDPILSGSGSHSCSTCHNPALAWGDGVARAVGQGQTRLALRSPTLLDIAWIPRLGWDGKFRDLESVAFGPITARSNMNLSEETLLARLSASPAYINAFAAGFGTIGITRRNVELALATFQRSIVSRRAPFDRWVEGDDTAISAAAKRGFDLFNGKAHCSGCHNGFSFTDGSFHDIGTAKDTDIGRGRFFPNSVKLRYAFKTPTLRDVTLRAPYMHDGSIATLEEVIDLYDRGGIERPSRSVLIRPLGLTDAERTDLIAFLGTLTAAPKTALLPR